MRKVTTVAYLLKDRKVCLGKKKRGFGEGYWNGYGGKVEEGEAIINAAIRELKEESGVDVRADDLEGMGMIEFFFRDGSEIETHVFFIREWSGEPIETDEMAPRWFSYDEMPYELMWEDDRHWMPRALAGEKVHGKVWFEEDGRSIEKMEWRLSTLTPL